MTAQHELVVTLFMSMSVNGMIARPHGSEDFLSNINWQAFVDLAKAAGAVAWGRKTHEKFRRVAHTNGRDRKQAAAKPYRA